MKTLDYLAEKIRAVSSALIFCHVRPDGDTLGSAFALKSALETLGKKADVVCDSEIPTKFDFLPYKGMCFKPEKVSGKYDLHIAVDVASENLLGGSWALFRSNKNVMCIDHHPSNERYVTDCYIENAASASIIIYKLIGLLGAAVNADVATGILLGVVTDTGNFLNPNTDAEALKIASEVMNAGADYANISYQTKKITFNRAKLLSDVLTHARYYFGNKLSIIYTSPGMLEKYGVKNESNEGFVDLPLWIDGVVVSVSLLEEKHNFFRVSFRSRGAVDVNAVAGEFGGGGHANASGCVIRGCLEEAIERIVRAVEVNSDF